MEESLFIGSDGTRVSFDYSLSDSQEARPMRFMGVYLVVAESEIIYVGKSVDVSVRWRSHERMPDFVDLGMTQVLVIKCGTRSELAGVEAGLVKSLKPPLNRIQPSSTARDPESTAMDFIKMSVPRALMNEALAIAEMEGWKPSEFYRIIWERGFAAYAEGSNARMINKNLREQKDIN